MKLLYLNEIFYLNEPLYRDRAYGSLTVKVQQL